MIPFVLACALTTTLAIADAIGLLLAQAFFQTRAQRRAYQLKIFWAGWLAKGVIVFYFLQFTT
jgi:hypothetical protein